MFRILVRVKQSWNWVPPMAQASPVSSSCSRRGKSWRQEIETWRQSSMEGNSAELNRANGGGPLHVIGPVHSRTSFSGPLPRPAPWSSTFPQHSFWANYHWEVRCSYLYPFKIVRRLKLHRKWRISMETLGPDSSPSMRQTTVVRPLGSKSKDLEVCILVALIQRQC